MLHIRKRGKKLHIRGTVRVGRETRAVKEHSCGTDRREIADAYKSKLEEDIRFEILHGRGGRTHSLTIADAGLAYIARSGGVKSYDIWRIGEFNKVVGDRPIAQAADAWSDFKRLRCGGLSPVTVQRFRAIFSAALNHLAKEEGFEVPQLPKRTKVESASKKRVQYRSKEQADSLIAAYAEHVQPIAILLCFQGLRIGEALRVEWGHVSWSGNGIFVPETKNGDPRTVSLHKRVRSALHKLWIERGSPKAGAVFLTQLGLPYVDRRESKFPSGSGIKKAHATACRRAGVTDFHVHDWRHHWASWCVMSGIDLETIRQEGGWKSLRMVERYATVSAAHRRRVMAKLK